MNKTARAGRISPRVRVSVVIPVAPKASAGSALASLEKEGSRQLEVIQVQGSQPARQRNLAAHRARGEYLYFLDHDSQVGPGAIGRLLEAFSDKEVGAAGGPNLGARLKSLFTSASELVLGSRLGSLTVWRRYVAGGNARREVGEESLILCNLMVRKELFIKLGGFDPRLYPNEENEFLNRLRRAGSKAVYVPDAQVKKPRASCLAGFLRENFRYARGRMEQIWINPCLHDAPYLSALAALAGFVWAAAFFPPAAYGILFVYFAAAAIEGFRLAANSSHPAGIRLGLLAAGLMIMRHFTYAAGLVFGGSWGWRKRSLSLYPDYFAVMRYRPAGGALSPAGGSLEPVGPPEVRGREGRA